MAMAANERYIVVTRRPWWSQEFVLFSDARAFAIRQSEPVDVHHNTRGHVVWTWEERP